MFAYQPKFSLLDSKEDKGTEYIILLKSKGLFKSRDLSHPFKFSCMAKNCFTQP